MSPPSMGTYGFLNVEVCKALLLFWLQYQQVFHRELSHLNRNLPGSLENSE